MKAFVDGALLAVLQTAVALSVAVSLVLVVLLWGARSLLVGSALRNSPAGEPRPRVLHGFERMSDEAAVNCHVLAEAPPA